MLTPPPQKWWPQKEVMKGAECAEETGKNNFKNSPFFFFRVTIENWGDFFTKMTITRKMKIGKI